MKPNKKIVRKLIRNLKSEIKDLSKQYLSIIEEMERAKTVEEIMALKQELLIAYLEEIPLNDRCCYFCIKHEKNFFHNCYKCEYGAIHGECSREDSDYSGIINRLNDLSDYIELYYYKTGETYE